MNSIPIILAADNNYAPYMSVAMISILENAKNNAFFDFFLLVPDSFKEEYKNKIEKDCSFYLNKELHFINMKNSFSQTKRMIEHIGEQTYYRLLAAEILPQKYDKCLYLDIDVIVNSDLSQMFEIDLADNYVAGVKAPGYHFPDDGNRAYCEKIGIPSIEQYINAGVILLNLKKIRENNLTPILCEEALKNYPTVDQDVINKMFYDRILHLPFKYNVTTPRVYNDDSLLQKCFTFDEIQEARNNPLIIHYADKVKPWNNPFTIMSDIWWKYARKSCFYSDIIGTLIKSYVGENMKNLIQNIFSVKDEANHKIAKICGLKIKLRRKKKNVENNLNRDKFLVQLKRITPRVELDSVGFHLVDHCNLNCRCCDVCSPIANERFVTLESFTKDIKRLSILTKDNPISQISFSGGEALLNPNLLEMFEIAREYFPAAVLRLQSNGILLLEQDEKFWQHLKQNNVTICCTKYPVKLDYKKIKITTQKYGISFEFFNDEKIIKTSYLIPFDIEGKQDARDNFVNCFHANTCIGIHDGKLYTCSPAANAHHFNKYFNTKMLMSERDYIDIHKAKDIDEILTFLAKPIPFCKYCNVSARVFDLPWGISKKDIKEWTL